MTDSVPFSDLALPAPLLESLASLGFTDATPVQAASLPAIVAGRDVRVRADTGSGKTLAFALGMLRGLEARLEVQALALCPTRELAEQVSEWVRRLARRMPNTKVVCLCGGVPFAPQRASLKQGAHVVVGTPGRIEEHLRKGSLSLAQLRVLVLDEADRMLDMGFEPQIAAIAALAPAERQTLAFSATYPSSIESLSQRYQKSALVVDLPSEAQRPGGVAKSEAPLEEIYFSVEHERRISALLTWLATERPQSVLVFCSTRSECSELGDALQRLGWAAASLHGELSQRERTHVMRLFTGGSCTVLTATDVAARGWDIDGLDNVVNLGLSRDLTVHWHRIGRTARQGRPGRVVSFVSEQDVHALAALERAQGHAVSFRPLPEPPTREGNLEPPAPLMATLVISAGKDKKLRAGDVLGALTGEGGIDGADVGAIQIDDGVTYVAVKSQCAARALARLALAGVKGRRVKAQLATLSVRAAGDRSSV